MGGPLPDIVVKNVCGCAVHSKYHIVSIDQFTIA